MPKSESSIQQQLDRTQRVNDLVEKICKLFDAEKDLQNREVIDTLLVLMALQFGHLHIASEIIWLNMMPLFQTLHGTAMKHCPDFRKEVH